MPCGCGSANGGNGTIASAQIQERSIITNEQLTSWNQLRNCDPKDPTLLIANANIGEAKGVYMSTIKFNPSTTWVTENYLKIVEPPACIALDSTDGQKVADAATWNFQHLSGPANIAGLPPQMYNVLFLRGGTQWKMRIHLQTDGRNMKQIMLSFFENAAMIGDCRGEVPVISFARDGQQFQPDMHLDLTLSMYGKFHIGLTGIDQDDQYVFVDYIWVVVP